MAYKLANHQAGFPALDDVRTTAGVPPGTIVPVMDYDQTIPRGGEAIYLEAEGAAIVVGSLVEVDHLAGSILAPATGGVGSVAVSLNIVPDESFAWFLITGIAAIKAPNAATPGAAVFSLAAVPGSVDDAAVNGEQILNAEFNTTTGTPATGLAEVEINRPFHQGRTDV